MKLSLNIQQRNFLSRNWTTFQQWLRIGSQVHTRYLGYPLVSDVITITFAIKFTNARRILKLLKTKELFNNSQSRQMLPLFDKSKLQKLAKFLLTGRQQFTPFSKAARVTKEQDLELGQIRAKKPHAITVRLSTHKIKPLKLAKLNNNECCETSLTIYLIQQFTLQWIIF